MYKIININNEMFDAFYKSYQDIIKNDENYDYTTIIDYKEMKEEYLNSLINNLPFYLLSFENLIVGWIIISPLENESDGYLEIGIEKNHQSKNFGTKLLMQALDKSKDHYNKIYLDVYTKNTRAINFYQKNGFKVIDKKDKVTKMFYKT